VEKFKLGNHDAIIINIWDSTLVNGQYKPSFSYWTNILFNSNNLHLILDCSQEWEGITNVGLPDNERDRILNLLKEHNLKNNNIVTVITGRASYKRQVDDSYKADWWVDTLAPVIDFYHIWPTFFLVWHGPQQYIKDAPLDHSNIDKLFVCKNRLPHPFRCALIDELEKHNLINDNLVTLIDPKDMLTSEHPPYKFKYYSGEKRVYEYDKDHIEVQPNEYKNCFIEVVSESNTVDFYTEKTVQPIIFEKPFIIYGAKNASRYLQKFGFAIFDELIDYSFDALPTFEERAAGLAAELLRIKSLNLNYNDVRKTLEPKIKHNLHRLIELIKHDEYMPNIIRELAKSIPEEILTPGTPEYVYSYYKNNQPIELQELKKSPYFSKLL